MNGSETGNSPTASLTVETTLPKSPKTSIRTNKNIFRKDSKTFNLTMKPGMLFSGPTSPGEHFYNSQREFVA